MPHIVEISLSKFKRISDVTIQLAPINVLVGGNNSGKSSILQGIHFSVMAAVAGRELGLTTFPQNKVLYCPAADFTRLCHNAPYENNSTGRRGKLVLRANSSDGTTPQYSIEIYKGRNAENIGCERSGDFQLGQAITESEKLYTIYVPGLAGIPESEEFHSERVVRQGVARGDANLFLRNVLFLIKEQQKLSELIGLMAKVFPSFRLDVSFDRRRHTTISCMIGVNRSATTTPLELAGTGVLQALQIFAYVTLFKPKLLLLDEPDSHLHPDNQFLISDALRVIARESETRVILSTHSRHILNALEGDANYIWLKDGRIKEQSAAVDRLSVLLDIGALDDHERLLNGQIDRVFLTEDANKKYLRVLLQANDFNMTQTKIYSYKGVSSIDAAYALGEFIRSFADRTDIVIHRDRDFMTSDETQRLADSIARRGFIPYITKGSDIEAYFIQPEHLCNVLQKDDSSDVGAWLDTLARDNHNVLLTSFNNKRDEIKRSMYRGREDECPSKSELIGADIPLPPDKRKGKDMLRYVNGSMFTRFGLERRLDMSSQFLRCDRLQEIGNRTERRTA